MSDKGDERGELKEAVDEDEYRKVEASIDIDGTGEEEPRTPEERVAEARLERRLKWKMDMVILPLLALTYFLSSMGRADLANANVAGLSHDLGLSPKQYANAASIFQVGYILLQMPGTVLVRKIGPPLQFGLAALVWGVVTVCHIKASTYGTLMGLRVLVGAAEAFIQGSTFYLSFWYTYTELVTRGAIFYSASALAGSFNGLIAYGIELDLAGHHGWKAWQWLYLIEGVIPIGCSFFIIFLLPPTPETGHFLFTKAERQLAIRRSRRTFNPVDARLRPKLLFTPLVEVRFWLLVAIYSFNHFCAGSLTNFLPAIINGFGYSIVQAQLMSVIVYACALVGINLFAQIADRMNRRGIPLIAASTVALVGYVLLLAVTNDKARLASTCILAFGLFATIPISATWLVLNIGGYTKRGSASAIMNMVAQAFAIIGTQAFTDPPFYRKGIAASLSLTVAHIIAVVLLLWLIKRANDKKAKLRAELSPEELQRRKAESWDIVGDHHINFNYGY